MKSLKTKSNNVLKQRTKKYVKWKSTAELGILALPAIVWFIVFAYIPMFGIVIAFKDFEPLKGIFGSEWNGFENFKYLFATNDATWTDIVSVSFDYHEGFMKGRAIALSFEIFSYPVAFFTSKIK